MGDPITMMAASAGVGALTSAFSGARASREARREAAKQEALQQQDLELRKRMYEEEKAYVQPIREALTAEAMSDEPLDYAQIAAQVKDNYAAAKRRLSATPGGLSNAALQGANLSEASALAGAYAQGKAARRALRSTLLSKDATAALGSNVAAGHGQQASAAGQRAAAQEAAARESWSNVARGLGSAATLYGSRPATINASEPNTYFPIGGSRAIPTVPMGTTFVSSPTPIEVAPYDYAALKPLTVDARTPMMYGAQRSGALFAPYLTYGGR
jgi:hypothetical protein